MKLTIGLPVYNGEDYIRESLDSLLSQECPVDLEIYISDNCSTDSTPQILQEYAKKDKRIILSSSKFDYIEQMHERSIRNIGSISNFNKVFYETKSDFFMWASHDDICYPGYLKECLNLLLNIPSLGLVWTKTLDGDVINTGKEITDTSPLRRFKIVKDAFYMEGVNLENIYHGVFRRSVLEKAMPLEIIPPSLQLLILKTVIFDKAFCIQKLLYFKRGGGESSDWNRVISGGQITNPIAIKYQWLTQEYLLQKLLWRISPSIAIFSLWHFIYTCSRRGWWKVRNKLDKLCVCV